MNITTNYNRMAYNSRMLDRQSKPINPQTNFLNQSTDQLTIQNSAPVQFTGIEKLFKPVRKLIQNRDISENNEELFSYAASVLCKDKKYFEKLLVFQPQRRVDFFGGITEKYNRQNFYLNPAKKENPDNAITLFKHITFPKNAHFNLLDNTGLTLEQSQKIFDKFENNSDLINKTVGVYKDLTSLRSYSADTAEQFRERPKDLTMKLVESPNAVEYIKNYEKYKPFIFSHGANDKNVVAKLDEQVAMGTFDPKTVYARQELEKLFVNVKETESFNRNTLFPHFSDEGNELLKTVNRKFYMPENPVSKEDSPFLTNIYKTTNKKNIDARTKFIEHRYFNYQKREQFPNDEFKQLNELFTKMDEAPKVMKFISKISSKCAFHKTEDYVSLIDKVKPSVLCRDTDKIGTILSKKRWDNPIDDVLKFYETEPKTRSGRLIKRIKGFFVKEKPDANTENIYTSPAAQIVKAPVLQTAPVKNEQTNTIGEKVIEKAEEAVVNRVEDLKQQTAEIPAIEQAKPVITPNLPAVIHTNPVIKSQIKIELPKLEDIIAPQRSAIRLPEGTIFVQKPAETTAQAAQTGTAAAEKTAQTITSATKKSEKTRRTFFKPLVEKQPSAKKLVVINDVNGIIEKKLGPNVYDDQRRAYANKATKMRLSFLPEIFDSIKETRATARRNGTFNRKTTVKNEDALGLYQRINGKNKRLVNYMLKVRNADGTRKYNINDIVETLNETNKMAKEMKIESTKQNPFTPKDEKALYDIIADEQIAKYGKLQRKKSKKS